MMIQPRSQWIEFGQALGDNWMYHMDMAFGLSIESRVNINGRTFLDSRHSSEMVTQRIF